MFQKKISSGTNKNISKNIQRQKLFRNKKNILKKYYLNIIMCDSITSSRTCDEQTSRNKTHLHDTPLLSQRDVFFILHIFRFSSNNLSHPTLPLHLSCDSYYNSIHIYLRSELLVSVTTSGSMRPLPYFASHNCTYWANFRVTPTVKVNSFCFVNLKYYS